MLKQTPHQATRPPARRRPKTRYGSRSAHHSSFRTTSAGATLTVEPGGPAPEHDLDFGCRSVFHRCRIRRNRSRIPKCSVMTSFPLEGC